MGNCRETVAVDAARNLRGPEGPGSRHMDASWHCIILTAVTQTLSVDGLHILVSNSSWWEALLLEVNQGRKLLPCVSSVFNTQLQGSKPENRVPEEAHLTTAQSVLGGQFGVPYPCRSSYMASSSGMKEKSYYISLWCSFSSYTYSSRIKVSFFSLSNHSLLAPSFMSSVDFVTLTRWNYWLSLCYLILSSSWENWISGVPCGVSCTFLGFCKYMCFVGSPAGWYHAICWIHSSIASA